MTKAFDKTSWNPCAYSKKAGNLPRSLLSVSEALLTQIELCDDYTIPLNIRLIQIAQKAAAMSNHLQKSAT
jgi:hypothetical protein